MTIPEFGDRDILNGKELAEAEARPERFARYVEEKVGVPASYKWEPRITDESVQWDGHASRYRFRTGQDSARFVQVVNNIINLHCRNGNNVVATPAVVEQIGRIADTDNDGYIGKRELDEVEAKLNLWRNPAHFPLPSEKKETAFGKTY